MIKIVKMVYNNKMSEKPKLNFSNANYVRPSLAEDVGDIPKGINEARLHAFDASEEIYQAHADTVAQKEEAIKNGLKDPLTGCFNERYFEEYKEGRFDPMREDGKVGLAYIDLDNLGVINNTKGHAFGDKALVELSDYLNFNTRKAGDIVVRLHGDEFVIISHYSDESDGSVSFESSLKARMKTLHEQSEVKFSYGCAVFNIFSEDNLDDTLGRADNDMYTNKHDKKLVE